MLCISVYLCCVFVCAYVVYLCVLMLCISVCLCCVFEIIIKYGTQKTTCVFAFTPCTILYRVYSFGVGPFLPLQHTYFMDVTNGELNRAPAILLNSSS